MLNKLCSRSTLVRAVISFTVAASTTLTVFQMASPASAATNQFKGVNWADARDNYNSGWVIPTGLASNQSYSTVYSVANNYITAFKNNLGANTVRLPINPPSVSQAWWASYQGAIDAALNDGFKVILGAWTESSSTGTITDMTAWNAMWDTVVNKYGGNGNVYFEPLNEPFGYSLSSWVSICSGWLSRHSNIPHSRVLISGTGYNDNVTGVGGSSALNGTLLSLHFYGYWASYTNESDWVNNLQGRIGSYTSRTVIDEFGAPMTTGLNYLGSHNGNQWTSYLAAVTDTARSSSMGTIYWPGLRSGDSYSMEYQSGSGLGNNNSSGVTQLRWGYGY